MNISNIHFVKSIAKLEETPKPGYPEIAFIGRSNVGKSSMINTLFNQRNLAKISSTPGKTRLINYFSLDNKLYIVDLPGYGFTKQLDDKSKKWKLLIETYLSKNERLKNVFLLIDCRHDLMELDHKMIQWLNYYLISFKIILTKRDKLSNNQFNTQWARLNQSLPNIALIPFSAKSREGREEVLEIIESYL